MEFLPGPGTRVFECLDQLGGPLVANPIQAVGILSVLAAIVRFRRGGDHEERRPFKQDNLGRAACLCEGREVFREDVCVGDQTVNDTRPRLKCGNARRHKLGAIDKTTHPVKTLVVDTRPKHGDLEASALLFELCPLLG